MPSIISKALYIPVGSAILFHQIALVLTEAEGDE
jgi:hypothetical protein